MHPQLSVGKSDAGGYAARYALGDRPYVPVKLLGWLLTAFAVSFGAPFWFDALSKLGSLRTSGPKPTPTT